MVYSEISVDDTVSVRAGPILILDVIRNALFVYLIPKYSFCITKSPISFAFILILIS